jgi:hypothetical protein
LKAQAIRIKVRLLRYIDMHNRIASTYVAMSAYTLYAYVCISMEEDGLNICISTITL